MRLAGIALTSGAAAYGCPHMAEWLPVFTALCIKRGYIRQSLDIVQAQGGSPLSGGTHVEGTALDITQMSAALVADAREAGARAAWRRGRAWAQDFDDHTHLAIDCPCASGADYQTAAVDAGYDGLGYMGRAHRDYEKRPTGRRDYRAGIVWMQQQLLLGDEHLPSGAIVIVPAETFTVQAAQASPTAPITVTQEEAMPSPLIYADDKTVAVLGTEPIIFQTPEERDCYLACLNSTEAKPVQAQVLQVVLRAIARTRDFLGDLNRGAGERALGLS